jgi:superfamily II DNA or RNA helicase/HKD family nuclease
MSFIYEDFFDSLKAGYFDNSIQSKGDYIPQLLVNSKKDGIKFLTTIEKELLNCNEFWISVAFVTTSGVAAIFNTLIELKERNIKGKLLVSSYLFFTQPEALRKLLHFDNIELRIATNDNFHSKGYLFYNGFVYDLIIGSSNLTANALCSNKEWNLKVSATPKSYIIGSAIREFKNEFENATIVDNTFIYKYDSIFQQNLIQQKVIQATDLQSFQLNEIVPNLMQREALENLRILRLEKKTKALLISATGTGKTYLSAFDAKSFNPNKLLFVVHRHNIAEAALKTFKKVFKKSKTMSHYSSANSSLNCDFIFSTIQTISKDDHLNKFDPELFDYIVIDETHRAGADTYQRIINHFRPKFLLGMTATPERTDGYNIFQLFEYNIAYEIRLHRALEEDMLSPFHYYGVTDITVDGTILEDNADFRLLAAEERINRIIEKANLYGCDDGRVRGLVFCSRKEECIELSKSFNLKGFNTIALTGDNSEDERSSAIELLESDNLNESLEYIFTVDIFNEGIDIPRVNQVIMLRPTQSAIIFVQQLGRGLRKTLGKEYLTVIDFIGNYANNYLVPIALYGDTTYNKDTLRKFLASGSNLIPGASTINFDRITKERIFDSINSAKMHLKKDLKKDYELLKFKIGRIPLMVDYIEHGSRDPQLYVESSRSYYNFLISQEDSYKNILSNDEEKLLELFSNDINNTIRVEESLILKLLLEKGLTDLKEIKSKIFDQFGYHTTDDTIESSLRNINFEFITENSKGTKVSVKEKYNIRILEREADLIEFHENFILKLKKPEFRRFFQDNVDYSIKSYKSTFEKEKYFKGFILYRKYSRKDVFRLLNWDQNPIAQNVGGYILSKDRTNCPIFVTYHKEETISNSTKYEDKFISKSEFQWMTKSIRTLSSPEVVAIKTNKNLRLPLFVKKSNDEGIDFYYIGELAPIEAKDSFVQEYMNDDSGKKVPVVKIQLSINPPVEDILFDYITNS